MATTEQRSRAQLLTEERRTGVIVTPASGDGGNYRGPEELQALGAIIDRAEAAGERCAAPRDLAVRRAVAPRCLR